MHRGLRVGLVLAILVGVFALVPAVMADSPCTNHFVRAPKEAPWGSSFEVVWDPIPGAAQYAVMIEDNQGVWIRPEPSNNISITVSTNDYSGSLLTISINAMNEDGGVLCVLGGSVALTAGGSPDSMLTVHAPPEVTTTAELTPEAIRGLDELGREVNFTVVQVLTFGVGGR
jgi:hypothetical protein